MHPDDEARNSDGPAEEPAGEPAGASTPEDASPAPTASPGDDWMTVELPHAAAGDAGAGEALPPADDGWSEAPAAPIQTPPPPAIPAAPPAMEEAPPAAPATPGPATPAAVPTPVPSAAANVLGALGDALAGVGIKDPQTQQLVLFGVGGLVLLCGVCVCTVVVLSLIVAG